MQKSLEKEQIEWSNFRWHEAIAPGKKRILLIGDSIVVGHGEVMWKMIQKKYALDYLATSKCVSDIDYRAELDYMLKRNIYEVIVFNNGLHGFKVDDQLYSHCLRTTMKYLKRQPSCLFWRNSTPMLEAHNHTLLHSQYAERIEERNKFAKKHASDLNIPTIDLFHPMLENREFFAEDGTHYNENGRRRQAELILDSLNLI